MLEIRKFRPDEPCPHSGCLQHVSHPREGCGRIAGRYPSEIISELRAELEQVRKRGDTYRAQ